MSRAHEALAAARGVAGRGKRYGSALALRAGSATRRRRVPGLLSIVVPCYNVEDYLDECLHSLRSAEYQRIEIVVVDDGSPDRCAAIARSHALRDPRVRLVRRKNGGLGAARNTGIDAARGEFLTFVDSDDVVTPHGHRTAIEALQRTGSDFALLNYDRLDNRKVVRAARWIRLAHAQERLATNLTEFPQAMVNAVAWSKVYRRDFWNAAGLRFPERVLYEDQAVSASAFAQAKSFDVLPHIGVHWRIRVDGTSISQGISSVPNLLGHQEALRASLAALQEHGHEAAAKRRRVQLLANNMGPFCRGVAAGDADYWEHLRACIIELFEDADLDEIAHRLDAHDKALYSLIRQGLRDEVVDFVANMGHVMTRFRSRVTDAGVVVELPVANERARAAAVLSDRQLAFESRVLGAAFTDDGGLDLRGWMYIENLDHSEHPPALSLDAFDEEGTRVPLALTTYEEPRADRLSAHHYASSREGGFRAHLDSDQIAGLSGVIQFEGRVEAAGLVRTGVLDRLSLAGSAQISQRFDANTGSLRLSREAGRGVVLTACEPLDHTRGGSGRGIAGPSGSGWWFLGPGGGVIDDPALCRAVDVELSDDTYTVFVETGPTLQASRFLLRTETFEVEGVGSPQGDLLRLDFPLTTTRWGRAGLALPSGKYSLRVEHQSGALSPIRPTYALMRRLPEDAMLERHRVVHEIETRGGVSLALTLSAPWKHDELGRRAARILRETYEGVTADREAFFFRSLYGEVTNCNGLGVHEEIRRRGLPVDLLWSIADHSVPVPEGGIGVVEGTREWFEAIHRSKYHMVNVHQLAWFSKPEGQTLIQTMHGYPYKIMGHAWWAKGPFKLHQIENYDRRAREWDYFVSPATYATPLLTEAFLTPAASTAEVLEIGYPRNDVLVGERGAEIRQRTRELLGIRPQQKAVLYGPTFRDYLAVNDMHADLLDLLDADRAADDLGEDYVVLVRGHAFNARVNKGRVAGHERVIDVTDHPDINELILASDAAVLDYSSLRFDYALTDKPMVFLVPDLEKYNRYRGGILPYEETAPGPRLTTARETVAALRDLDRLTKEWAQARQTFREKYVDLDDGHAAQRLVDRVLGEKR